jgi:hypothetical protein
MEKNKQHWAELGPRPHALARSSGRSGRRRLGQEGVAATAVARAPVGEGECAGYGDRGWGSP